VNLLFRAVREQWRGSGSHNVDVWWLLVILDAALERGEKMVLRTGVGDAG